MAISLTKSIDRGSLSKDMNSLYQIEFTITMCGKRIASTKRRIRWRFGFTNREALNSGLTGTDCRGEEHDITLIWSLTSGKRFVVVDSQEVHYSNVKSNIFDFSWTLPANHVFKIVAHASSPLTGRGNSFRQYNFFVNGLSFFNMPEACRLGLSKYDPDHGTKVLIVATSSRHCRNENIETCDFSDHHPCKSHSDTITDIEAPHNRDEEEAYLEQAIQNSILAMKNLVCETNHGIPEVEAPDEDLLLDFLSEPETVKIDNTIVQQDSSRDLLVRMPPNLMDIGSKFSSAVYKTSTSVVDSFNVPIVNPVPIHTIPTDKIPKLIYGKYSFPKDAAIVHPNIPPFQISSSQSPRIHVPPPPVYNVFPVSSKLPHNGCSQDRNNSFSKLDVLGEFELGSNSPENRKNPFDTNNISISSINFTGLNRDHESISDIKNVRRNYVDVTKNQDLIVSKVQHGNWRSDFFHGQEEFQNNSNISQEYGYQAQKIFEINGPDTLISGQEKHRVNNQTQLQKYPSSHQEPSHAYGPSMDPQSY